MKKGNFLNFRLFALFSQLSWHVSPLKQGGIDKENPNSLLLCKSLSVKKNMDLFLLKKIPNCFYVKDILPVWFGGVLTV